MALYSILVKNEDGLYKKRTYRFQQSKYFAEAKVISCKRLFVCLYLFL